MALKTCPDCGAATSPRARACPNCGRLAWSQTYRAQALVVAVLFALFVIAVWLGWI